jgi:hypothetical protein
MVNGTTRSFTRVIGLRQTAFRTRSVEWWFVRVLSKTTAAMDCETETLGGRKRVVYRTNGQEFMYRGARKEMLVQRVAGNLGGFLDGLKFMVEEKVSFDQVGRRSWPAKRVC